MKNTNAIALTHNLMQCNAIYAFLESQDNEKMALFYGVPGTGKTTAAKFYAKQVNAIFLSAFTGMTPFGLVKAILGEMDATCRSYCAGMKKLINMFSERQQALFIDEADFLLENPKLMEVLRTIHDQAGVTVFLFSMPGFYNKIAAHRQLCDRIHPFEFKVCDLMDAQRIVQACCKVKIADDLLQAIHEFTGGLPRLMRRCLAHVDAHCKAMKLKECDLALWGDQPLLPAAPAGLELPGFKQASKGKKQPSTSTKKTGRAA